MSPFNTTVFRVRLLLLALALGLMGVEGNKKPSRMADSGANPIKAVKAQQRKPQSAKKWIVATRVTSAKEKGPSLAAKSLIQVVGPE